MVKDSFASPFISAANPPSKDSKSYSTSSGVGQIGSLNSAKTYYWRVNTHYLNQNWHPSKTASLTTIACTPSASWTIKEPVVSGRNVFFAYSPESNSNIALIVKNISTGTVVYDSGALAAGKLSLQWNNAPPGSFSAQMMAFGQVTVSNTVNFRVPEDVQVSPMPLLPTCTQVDFDHDGSISILDQTLMSKSYGTKAGDSKYNKLYDLNNDGSVSILDMNIAAEFFGQQCIPTVND